MLYFSDVEEYAINSGAWIQINSPNSIQFSVSLCLHHSLCEWIMGSLNRFVNIIMWRNWSIGSSSHQKNPKYFFFILHQFCKHFSNWNFVWINAHFILFYFFTFSVIPMPACIIFFVIILFSLFVQLNYKFTRGFVQNLITHECVISNLFKLVNLFMHFLFIIRQKFSLCVCVFSILLATCILWITIGKIQNENNNERKRRMCLFNEIPLTYTSKYIK